MAGKLTPAGTAVATAKGHYPQVDGRHVARAPGETFVVFEGMTTAKWFKLLPADADPADVPAKAEPVGAPAEPDTLAGAAKAERKRKAEVKPPTGEDLV